MFNLHKPLKVTHLALKSSDLKSTSSIVLPLEKLSVDEAQQRGSVSLDHVPGGILKKGTEGVKLFFRFEGELSGDMIGYYKSEGDLDEKTGKKPMYVDCSPTCSPLTVLVLTKLKSYALTQFEPTSARKAFPCVDISFIN